MDEFGGGVGDVRLTRELLARGLARDDLALMTRAGVLDHVRRGAYAHASDSMTVQEQHRRLIKATLPQMSPDTVISHTSAAIMHELPVVNRHVDRVHVTKSRPGGQGRTGRYVHVHGAAVDGRNVVLLEGLRVTDLPRTVVDSARILPLGPGLAIADAAMRLGSEPNEWDAALTLLGRRRGVRTARRALELADPRSESAGESMSRALFVDQQIPIPDLQREIFDHHGQFVARVDFCWEEQRTIGEFDGKIKYGRALRPGQSIEDVIFAEKLREDALRDLGWQVVRWIWRDLFAPYSLPDRLNRAFTRGTRR